MDLTREALDYLMEQGIEPEERQLKINGQNYIINKDGEPVLVEPVIYKAKEPIRLNTLSGLVDYIKSNIADFDESKLWEVRIFYFDKLFTIRHKYVDLFEISDDNYFDIHDLDDLGKIINIVGKHLKKINYEWRNIE